MKKSYLCPFCKKKQTSVLSWENMDVAYEFDFETNNVEEKDRVGGEFITFACPSCGEDLPPEMDSEIRKLCGW